MTGNLKHLDKARVEDQQLFQRFFQMLFGIDTSGHFGTKPSTRRSGLQPDSAQV